MFKTYLNDLGKESVCVHASMCARERETEKWKEKANVAKC